MDLQLSSYLHKTWLGVLKFGFGPGPIFQEKVTHSNTNWPYYLV